jgi:hypothetical protein
MERKRNEKPFCLDVAIRLLPQENRSAYLKLRNSIFDELQPQGAIEHVLVDTIGADLWRLLRLEHAEAAHWKEKINAQAQRRHRTRQADVIRAQGNSGVMGIIAQARINALRETHEEIPVAREDVELELARSVSNLEALQISTMVDRLRQTIVRRICQSRMTITLMQQRRRLP